MADSNKKLIQRGLSTVAEVEIAINEKAREEYVEAQDAVTLEAAKAYTDTQVATCETPAGAQNKADTAAQAAKEAAITAAAAHSDTALKAHTDNAAIHKTSEQIRAEIVDADIPATLARVTSVDTKDAATLATAKEYTDTREGVIRTDFAAADAETLTAAQAYTDTTVAALVDGAPETLDTLKELADALKANEDGATAMLEVIGTKADAAATTAALAGKVDKEEGKGLSTNDYTDIEKEKLAGLDSYTLPAATAATLGGVKAGTNVEIDAEGRLSATAAPYELPTASSTVLGGVKIGDNLTVDADGRLNAPAGGGGSGGGGDCATIFMPWVEPRFDTDPNIPTNQQAFIDAWGPAIAKYSAAPERSRLVINVPFFEVSFKMDCQALPDTEIEAGIVGYTLAATAIVPMAPDGVNILGLRNYMSAHITIADGVITSVDGFLMSAMMNMETGLPNYLLDSASGVGGGGGSVVIDITDVSTSEAGVFDETQIKAAVQPHVATLIANPETRVMIRSGAILLPATAGATDADLWISSLETNPLAGGNVQNVFAVIVSLYCRIQNGVVQTAVGGIKSHDLATEAYVNAKIKAIQPDYTSLVEQLVPGEFWLCADGIKRQVYIRTFKGTTPNADFVVLDGVSSSQFVTGGISSSDATVVLTPPGFVAPDHADMFAFYWTYYTGGGGLNISRIGDGLKNKAYSLTFKYTKV